MVRKHPKTGHTIHNKWGLSFKAPSSMVFMAKVKISIVFWCGKKVTVIAESKASKKEEKKERASLQPNWPNLTKEK